MVLGQRGVIVSGGQSKDIHCKNLTGKTCGTNIDDSTSAADTETEMRIKMQ